MAEAIIARRGSMGIKAVVSDISSSGTSSYVYTDTFSAAYYENGDVFISATGRLAGGTSSGSFKVSLVSAPPGVSIYRQTPVSLHAVGSAVDVSKDCIYGFILSGITSRVSVQVEIPQSSSFSIAFNVTVTTV